MSESPEKRCARWDADWDECAGLLSGAAYSIGYHSRLNHQERVHPTRESAAYARALVEFGDPARYARALRCIRTVLALQDTDPYSPTYGIWPWYAEEPLSEMAPPDWNWADFVGTSLCHLHEALPPAFPEADALRAELREALLCAAYSIFRRNVRPDYTNIALMGTVVTGYAGETFAQPLLLAYARSRIRTFRTLLEETGGVAEYNSPTYSWVAVEECERLLALVRDDAVRRDTEHVLRFLWTDLARHFHPATRQLAGPHSRAYQLYTPESLLQQLPLPGNSAPCSCPADLREQAEAGGVEAVVEVFDARDLALARERYFTGGCKTLRVGKREVIRGFEGKLQGKLSRRGFFAIRLEFSLAPPPVFVHFLCRLWQKMGNRLYGLHKNPLKNRKAGALLRNVPAYLWDWG